MRPIAWLFVAALLGLSGCGYVGPVLPPSPLLPQAVTDLAVVQRGDQLIITFSTPARTTDNLPVKEFSDIDLRIGPAPAPFDFDQWAAGATACEVEAPPPSDPDNPLSTAISKTVPAAAFVGKRVSVGVRTSLRKRDHFSQWSNRVVLTVVPTLVPPQIKLEATAKGVKVTWNPTAGAEEYRVLRRPDTGGAPVVVGLVKTDEFVDTSSQFGFGYEYTVVAVHAASESLPSKPERITPKDSFAPSVPSGLTALGGPNSIEISWQRSPEADLKGYFVYRSVDNGPFERVGGLNAVPSFSDAAARHGTAYRYAVSSVDQQNNESDKSPPVEVSY